MTTRFFPWLARAAAAHGESRELRHSSPLLGGLRLRPERADPAIRAGLLAIGLVTIVIVLADSLVFRSILPGWYLRIFAGPDLGLRIVVYMIRCVQEELTYRLLLMTAIIATAGRIWRRADGRAAMPVVIMAILVAQACNMLPKTQPPATYWEVPWLMLRFYAPGVLWGWLYWRYGFVTPLLAHPAVHLVLQPVLLAVLAG